MNTVFLSRPGSKNADKFVNVVQRMLKTYNINKFETIGINIAEDRSPFESVKNSIAKSDRFVLCQTKDISTKSAQSIGIEYGIAKERGKPTMVFIETGVELSDLIKNSTQYIEFDGTYNDLVKKKNKLTH
jgi:hypothetical protein